MDPCRQLTTITFAVQRYFLRYTSTGTVVNGYEVVTLHRGRLILLYGEF